MAAKARTSRASAAGMATFYFVRLTRWRDDRHFSPAKDFSHAHQAARARVLSTELSITAPLTRAFGTRIARSALSGLLPQKSVSVAHINNG